MKILLLFLPLLAALGQDSLSLGDAIALGIRQSHSLVAASAGIEASQSKTQQARAGFLPKVGYAESVTRSNNPVYVFGSLLTQHQFGIQNFEIHGLNRPGALDDFQSLVTIDQSLYDGGLTRTALKSARLTQQISTEQAKQARMDVVFAIARAYYTALLAVDRLESAEQSLKSAQADLDRAKSIRDAGMSTDSDVLSLDVHLAAVREHQIQRSADLDVARAALNDAMGLPLDVPHTLTTALAPLKATTQDHDAMERTAVEARPDTRQLHLTTGLARSGYQSARDALKPVIVFHGAFEADRQRFTNTGGGNWLASVSLHWNLFNGFADKAKLAETTQLIRRAEAEEARAGSTVRLQVRRASADLRAAKERILTAEASVAESIESLRITKNRYDAGMSNVTDLIRNEAAVLDSRTRHASAIYDERIAAIMLEYAAGTLSTTSEVFE